MIPPDFAVLTLNGMPLTYGDIEKRIDEMAKESGRSPSRDNPTSEVYAFRMATRMLVLERMFVSMATQAGLAVDEADLKQEWKELEKLSGGKEAMGTWLSLGGHNEKEYRQGLGERQLVLRLLDKYLNENPPKAPGPEDVADYEKNKPKFKLPKRAKIRQIAMRCESQRVCMSKAARIQAMVRNGKLTFEQAASKYSDEPESKANGGDIGWVFPGMLPKKLEEAALNLEKGQISQPVMTQFGVHLFMASVVKEEGIATREEAMMLIGQRNVAEARRKAWRRMEEDAEQKAKILIAQEFRHVYPRGVFAPINSPVEGRLPRRI